MIVIGIDCATDPKKVGIALADCDEDRCALVAVELGKSHESLARKIASWLPSRGVPLLGPPSGRPSIVVLEDTAQSFLALVHESQA